MMLTRFVRIQLIIFSILTVIGLVVMATKYIGVPALVGIGRYDATVELPTTGGLYPHANVTYRGTTVGEVKTVTLTSDGVDAHLSLDSSVSIPADVDAQVKSVSAIGEQYVDLVPRGSGGADMSDGDVIPVDRTTVPQDVGPMLDQADALVKSISDTRLQSVIDESFKAFNGSGPDLQKLIDSTRLFVQEANANSGVTKQLLEQVEPLLNGQVVSSDAIRSWTSNLATFTDQLRASDPDLRAILQKGPGAAAEANTLFQNLRPTLPILLANLVSIGEVGVIYNAGIEQILVLYPPITAALMTAAGSGPPGEGAIVDFQLEVNDPPACTTGFLPADQRRDPNDMSVPDTPADLFCKVDQNDSTAVRGSRNLPCMEVPGRRAPTPEICRSDAGYVPLGNNPPWGPVEQGEPSYTEIPSGESSVTPAVAARPYDPQTGMYVAPGGVAYAQPGLNGGVSDLQGLMSVQQGTG
ncbi:MCE family protein [Rhodococcus sp. PAMC28707]|uniref:MCE family protein n=1 Tax=unclassified Rhodococcus (in: high G+C Gram-positive bacteria) TaxID=192944 RepID=UPI00109D941D|nr:MULTISPECIES: MlaD family protein [unclassified Rhodococcus (in: high G+C Gram-positive bacteria)]QCB50005.1 MCE family protein [Rhodococcus sp. PAMC28705]QCB58300.1 MCE family protein [Rhodococcus sp. PAMC28707]